MGMVAHRPLRFDLAGECIGICKLATQRTIGPYKIGIAELANSRTSVLLSARPQVATCETAKHGWSARIRTFTLQSVENFFHLITHCSPLYIHFPGELLRCAVLAILMY
jgi:hypothetical protein